VMKTLFNNLQKDGKGYYVFITKSFKSGKSQFRIVRNCRGATPPIRAQILGYTVPNFSSKYTSTCPIIAHYSFRLQQI